MTGFAAMKALPTGMAAATGGGRGILIFDRFLNRFFFSWGGVGGQFRKAFWHKHMRSGFRCEGITPGHRSQIRLLTAARTTQV